MGEINRPFCPGGGPGDVPLLVWALAGVGCGAPKPPRRHCPRCHRGRKDSTAFLGVRSPCSTSGCHLLLSLNRLQTRGQPPAARGASGMLWAGAVTLFGRLSPGEPGCRLTETSWEAFLPSYLASRGTEEKGDSTCKTQLRHQHGFGFLGGCFLNGTEGTAAWRPAR